MLPKNLLKLDGAANGPNRARELRQKTIPHGLEDPAVVLGELPFDQVFAERFQPAESAFLVGRHQPAIAHHISRKNGR